MGKEFTGRVAFVTGGASGIGAQVCRDLAAEGASVVIADVNLKLAQEVAASLPTEDGNQHLAVQLDVSNKAQVDDAVEQVNKIYGRPAELIVNSAGIAQGRVPIEDMAEEDFDRMTNITFKGTFLVTQAFGRELLKAGKPGSIVNVSSALAYCPWPGTSHYCASKAAVQQFSRVAAKEWGPKGIRVNSVHPGLIETPLTAIIKGHQHWINYEESTSLRRVGQPKDVSNGIIYLLSDKSSFVTGTSLEISGQGYGAR